MPSPANSGASARKPAMGEGSSFFVAYALRGSGCAHPSLPVPQMFCVQVEALRLSLQPVQLLLLCREGGTEGRLGALQLQDGFVAVLSILVNRREGAGGFWSLGSAVFPAVFPEQLFSFLFFDEFPKPVPSSGSVSQPPVCLRALVLTARLHELPWPCLTRSPSAFR